MRALEFWKAVTVDRANLLEAMVALLAEHEIRYCVIGGQAVNAYAEPVVTLDLDLVVAVDQLPELENLLRGSFQVKRFEHSLNVTVPDSNLRVQIQTDPSYSEFPQRASVREVLGMKMPVASIEDVLEGKIWAVRDPSRRPSKRLKDLSDIARIIENYPDLRRRVPDEILERLRSGGGE